MTKPRLLLVDDHDVVRIGTRELLRDLFEVVGEADNTQSAIELAEDRNPDVLLLDVRMGGGGGGVVAETLRRTRPDICIVAFSVSVKRSDVTRMINAGVRGYLTKDTPQHELGSQLLSAVNGGYPVSEVVAGFLLDIDDAATTESSIASLTVREREVVALIARGSRYKTVADELGISAKTVESHIANIFRKLDVSTRGEMTAKVAAEFLIHDD